LARQKSKPLVVHSDENGDGRLKASPLAKKLAEEKELTSMIFREAADQEELSNAM